MNKETFRSDSLIGEVNINMEYLQNQNLREEWKDIIQNGIKYGRLRMNLHYIYSKVKMFQDYLDENEEKKAQSIEERNKWKSLLDIFQGQITKNPFNF